MSPRTACLNVVMATALGYGPAALAAEIDPTRVDFAHAVYEGTPTWVHDHQPQALLRAVIVLRVKLGADNHWHAEVVRTNTEQPEMLRRAIETVDHARVPTIPLNLREKLTNEGFMETWLFDNDGTFQVKTLAKAQLNR